MCFLWNFANLFTSDIWWFPQANVKQKYDLSEIARESCACQRITLINVFTRTVRVTVRIISCLHLFSHSRARSLFFLSNNHPEADEDGRLNKPLQKRYSVQQLHYNGLNINQKVFVQLYFVNDWNCYFQLAFLSSYVDFIIVEIFSLRFYYLIYFSYFYYWKGNDNWARVDKILQLLIIQVWLPQAIHFNDFKNMDR